jgi:hypothetical protein
MIIEGCIVGLPTVQLAVLTLIAAFAKLRRKK